MLRLNHPFKPVQGPHDKALNAIAIPPPQRGKHCNTITTETPAVPPVITTNALSCVNGLYNPRTAIVTKIQAFGGQLSSEQKHFRPYILHLTTKPCKTTLALSLATLCPKTHRQNYLWPSNLATQILVLSPATL
jgi:hypothetical protein